jgi:hypothetical protein
MRRVAPLARRSPPAERLDLIAAGWGGLVGSIGLMVGTERDWPARLAASAIAFGIGGFLAGVRAAARRPLHAVAAWVVAYLLQALFVVLARIIDALGGPEAPSLVGEDGSDWLVAAVWALGFALIGGALANAWLRPASRRRVI